MQVKKCIINLKPYEPGKPIEELERELGIKNVVKLASNENPLGPSPKVIEAIKSRLGSINRYPDGTCYYLKKKLGWILGVDESRLVLGNGSNEIIELILKAFLDSVEEVLICEPTFLIYKFDLMNLILNLFV